MDNIVNLDKYRKDKEEAEIQKDIEYLRRVLDEIIASLPPMEDGAISFLIPVDSLEDSPFIFPQTNLDGYTTDEDK